MCKKARIGAGLALLLLQAAVLLAQEGSSSLSGSVVSADGDPLPGVTVTLEPGCNCEDCDDPETCTCCPDETGGAPQVVVSNAEGRFRFLTLTPGTYSVSASLEGFETATYTSIRVGPGQAASLEITLNPQVNR